MSKNLDIRMKMLEDELVTAIGERDAARREVTRLSNYETSYNNLRRIVDSQYNTINALHSQLARMEDESDEARAALAEEKVVTDTAILAMEEAERKLKEEKDNHNLVVGAYESRVGQLRENLDEARRELAEIPQMDVQSRTLPWLDGKGVLYAIYGASSAHYADEVEAKLREAQETIDDMRAEGCAAAAVLEDIFNGVTAAGVNHGDATIATVAIKAAVALTNVPRCEHEEEIRGLKQLAYNFLDFTPNCGDDNKCFTCGEQWYPNKCEVTCLHAMLFKATREANDASTVWLELCDARDDAVAALVNVPRCDHYAELEEESKRFTITLGEYADRIAELSDNNRILRDGWTADNKKLLDVQLALPAIIFGAVYYDLGEHGITWKVCVERWKRYWAPALAEEHGGDCTNEPQSCARCQAEDVMRLVDIVRKGLNDE